MNPRIKYGLVTHITAAEARTEEEKIDQNRGHQLPFDALHLAAELGDTDKIKEILLNDISALNRFHSTHGTTPICWAIENQQEEAIHYLLVQGANLLSAQQPYFSYYPLYFLIDNILLDGENDDAESSHDLELDDVADNQESKSDDDDNKDLTDLNLNYTVKTLALELHKQMLASDARPEALTPEKILAVAQCKALLACLQIHDLWNSLNYIVTLEDELLRFPLSQPEKNTYRLSLLLAKQAVVGKFISEDDESSTLVAEHEFNHQVCQGIIELCQVVGMQEMNDLLATELFLHVKRNYSAQETLITCLDTALNIASPGSPLTAVMHLHKSIILKADTVEESYQSYLAIDQALLILKLHIYKNNFIADEMFDAAKEMNDFNNVDAIEDRLELLELAKKFDAENTANQRAHIASILLIAKQAFNKQQYLDCKVNLALLIQLLQTFDLEDDLEVKDFFEPEMLFLFHKIIAMLPSLPRVNPDVGAFYLLLEILTQCIICADYCEKNSTRFISLQGINLIDSFRLSVLTSANIVTTFSDSLMHFFHVSLLATNNLYLKKVYADFCCHLSKIESYPELELTKFQLGIKLYMEVLQAAIEKSLLNLFYLTFTALYPELGLIPPCIETVMLQKLSIYLPGLVPHMQNGFAQAFFADFKRAINEAGWVADVYNFLAKNLIATVSTQPFAALAPNMREFINTFNLLSAPEQLVSAESGLISTLPSPSALLPRLSVFAQPAAIRPATMELEEVRRLSRSPTA